MNLVDRIIAGFKVQFLAKLVSAVAGAALIVALARLLQPQGYGLLMLALTVFGTFKLVARLGIGGSAGRYIADYRETNPDQVPHIVRFSLLLNLASIAVAVLLVIVSYQYVVDLLGEPELAPFLILGTVFMALGTIRTYLTKVLQGFENIRFEGTLRIVEPVSRLFFALGLVLAGFGALGALLGYIISSVVVVTLGAVYLFRRVQEFGDEDVSVESGLRRRIAEYALPLTATNSSKVLDNRIDTLLVGFFLSSVEVGFYVLADRVVKLVETPMDALGFTLSPTFGTEKAAGRIPRISRIYEIALINSLLLYIPAGAGLVLVADPMIRLVFGVEYAEAAIVVQVFGLYAVFKSITKLTDHGLDYLGRARDRAIVRAITAVLNVLLNIALIPLVGVVGAAIATVTTYGLYTGANLYLVSLELELRPRYLLRQLSIIGLITLAMSAVVYSLVGYINGWISLFAVVGVGGLIWSALSTVTGLLDVRKIVSTLV